jgi:Arc/MetJ-type ribon-helix-helix transcriptional regulator
MATHSVTIQLSENAFQSIKHRLDSGRYATVEDVIEEALSDLDLSTEAMPVDLDRAYAPWSRDEAIAAYDEFMANPAEVYTSQQVRAYLAEQRASDSSST